MLFMLYPSLLTMRHGKGDADQIIFNYHFHFVPRNLRTMTLVESDHGDEVFLDPGDPHAHHRGDRSHHRHPSHLLHARQGITEPPKAFPPVVPDV